MHHLRFSDRKFSSFPNGAHRKSFQVGHVTIDIGKDFNFKGGIKIVERGSGYVRVVVLYEEEIRWLASLCRRSFLWQGRKQQLGSIRGGARTVICSLISDGLGSLLEVRLFAPYGRRLIMIPLLKEGDGWDFLADLLDCFLTRSSQPKRSLSPPPGPPLSNPAGPLYGLAGSRTYLQVAALPEWKAVTLRSSHNSEHVAINFEDAVESSHMLNRCLVGWFRGFDPVKPDFSRIQAWVNKKWRFPGGVSVKEMDEYRFLFIFPSKEIAFQILNKDHFIDGCLLLLNAWQSWSCCSISKRHPNSVWLRVLGLPIFLRDYNVFRSIGNYCGGFLGVEEGWRDTSNYKWIRIQVKGDGRSVPSSIPVAVGSIEYDCPVWVERRPWMEWEEADFIDGVFRLPVGNPRVARVSAADVGPSWRNVHAQGRQRGKAFNGYRNQKYSLNLPTPGNRKVTLGTRNERSVKWVKVGEKQDKFSRQPSLTNQVGHTSINSFEALSTLQVHEPYQSETHDIPISQDLSPPVSINEPVTSPTVTINESIINGHYSPKEGFNTELNAVNVVENGVAITESRKSYGKVYCSRKVTRNINNSQSLALIPYNHFQGQIEDPSSDICNQSADDPTAKDLSSPLICTPITTCQSADWSPDLLMLKDCVGDQQKTSSWVLHKMKTFKKILGFSNNEVETKLMDLLHSIEEKRRQQQGGAIRRPKGRSKGSRELKNLQWSISYDKRSQMVSSPMINEDEDRIIKPLSISFE